MNVIFSRLQDSIAGSFCSTLAAKGAGRLMEAARLKVQGVKAAARPPHSKTVLSLMDLLPNELAQVVQDRGEARGVLGVLIFEFGAIDLGDDVRLPRLTLAQRNFP